MFGIGGFELFIILLFGFLVFGPDKLPEIAKTLGMALRKFQQAQKEMEAVIKDEVLDADVAKSKPASGKGAAKPAPTSSTESFAERKARYDKGRAEREAAKRAEIEANRLAMKKEAAREAAELREDAASKAPAADAGSASAAEPVASSAAKPAPAATVDAAAPASDAPAPAAAADTPAPAKPVPATTPAPAASSSRPTLSPDELFDAKPIRSQATPKAPASTEGGE